MAAPSFASFPERPKPADSSKPAQDASTARQDRDERSTQPRTDRDRPREADPRHGASHTRDRHRYEDKRRGRSGDSHKYRDDDRSSRKKRRLEENSADKYKAVAPAKHLSDASIREWYEDLRGDADNLRYGGISRSKVAEYRLSGAGYILGLPPFFRLQQDTKNHVGDGLRLASRLGDKLRGNTRAGLVASRTAQRLLANTTDDQSALANEDFLELPSRRRRRRHTEGPLRREIEFATSPSSTSESSEEEGPAPPPAEADSAQSAIIELQRHLEAVPTDVDGWIKLSSLQGAVPATGSDGIQLEPVGAGSRRAQSEIARAVLSKAMGADPQNQASIKLEMEYMRHAEVLWPPAKVTARWKYLIDQESRWKDERGYMEIWLGYIAWMEGRGLDTKADGELDGSEQGVEAVISLYADCINNMRVLALRRYPGEAEEENLVYLVLRACLFIRQAGFSERALSVMQAVLQINFALPASQPGPYQRSREDKRAKERALMAELETAWDEELPRIGDTATDGSATSGNTLATAATKKPVVPVSSPEDPFDSWYQAEVAATSRDWKSASATDLDDNVDDDDPLRVVLFSDISDFLCYLISPAAREQLVYAAIVFLELPHALPLAGTNTPFWSDPYLTGAVAKAAAQQNEFWPARSRTDQAQIDEAVVPLPPQPWLCPVKSWSQDVASILGSDQYWFRVMMTDDVTDKDAIFVRNTLQSLREFVPDVGIVSASVSWEYASRGIKQAVKTSKALLANDRKNTSLWLCYATLVGYESGRLSEARQVLATCLQAVDRADSKGVQAICATWAELELFKGDSEASLAVSANVLAAMSGGKVDVASPLFDSPTKTPTATVLLRAQRGFDEDVPFATLDDFKLKSIFAYLTANHDPSRAIAHLHFALTSIPHSSPESEAAHQHLVRLLHMHSQTRSTSPPLLRCVLEDAIRLFPSNTMFLSLYLAGEARGRVYGRVHTLIHRQLLRGRDESGCLGEAGAEVTPITALWAVWAEAQMAGPRFWDARGGAERVRSVFRAGAEMTRVRKSALFWRLYIEFEMHQARPSQAKAVCYRAIGELGACKDLYLLPFSPLLRPHFTPKELRAWADLMLERGLRVRVPFERFFSRREESELESGGEEEGAEAVEDDPFEKLHERVRLMPY